MTLPRLWYLQELAETLQKAIDLAVQVAAPATDPGVEKLQNFLKEVEKEILDY